MSQESRLTQNFLGLSDEAFRAVPVLEKALAGTINTHLDEHHLSTGTVMTALACVVGEFTLASGTDAQAVKAKFLEILDAYISTGMDGARVGPIDDRSLVRKVTPWQR
jgi:hypothetical protein